MGLAGVVMGRAGRARSPGFSRPVDFRRLLGGPAWRELPAAVQHRFAVTAHLTPTVYEGTVSVRASLIGKLIAQACRLVGTPLAPWTGDGVPVRVDVWGDTDGGLVWDRTYAFADRPVCRVSSKKMMGADGRLMEVVQGGLGMTLALSVEAGALHFRSTGYFFTAAGRRIPIPGLITPGRAHVTHEDQGGGWFRFTLGFVHPLLGETMFQTGLFRGAPYDVKGPSRPLPGT